MINTVWNIERCVVRLDSEKLYKLREVCSCREFSRKEYVTNLLEGTVAVSKEDEEAFCDTGHLIGSLCAGSYFIRLTSHGSGELSTL